jgi:hypothetical protein
LYQTGRDRPGLGGFSKKRATKAARLTQRFEIGIQVIPAAKLCLIIGLIGTGLSLILGFILNLKRLHRAERRLLPGTMFSLEFWKIQR